MQAKDLFSLCWFCVSDILQSRICFYLKSFPSEWKSVVLDFAGPVVTESQQGARLLKARVLDLPAGICKSPVVKMSSCFSTVDDINPA